jgi:23S rRNA pseudouridine2605 synthase
MSAERLQKILAQAGIASRRKAEEMIQQGLVTVNGKTAKIGDKADFETDHIKVDGTLVRRLEDQFYVLFHKPKGVISMMGDPEGRPTLNDFLQKLKVHVNPIGRLDFNSDGLLLLTNDGAMAEKIQKSDQFPRIYHVKIKGHITSEMIERLTRGVRIANKFAKPLSVRINEELNKKTKIEIVFMNAANVDVKAFFEAKGFLVEKITRTGIGHLTLHGLEPGKYRIVPKSKFEALVEQPELGVKALEHRVEKEREILPRDKRLRNVDEFGKVIVPEIAADGGTAARVTVRPGRAGSARPSIGRSPGGPKAKASDRIVVRAGRGADDEATPAAKKRTYSDSVDMPKFKRRDTRDSGARFGGADERRPARRDSERSGSSDRKPRSGGFAGKPRFSDSRGPRRDSEGGGFGGAKPRAGGFSKSRAGSDAPRPRREGAGRPGGFGGKPRFSEAKPRSGGFGGARSGGGRSAGGGARRPIARVKRRED